MPIIIHALGTVLKNETEIRKVGTELELRRQITVLLGLIRILRKVLGSWGDLLSLNTQRWPRAWKCMNSANG